jgi:hypothetical protein
MRVFRPGATIWPLFAWTLLVVVAAVLFERLALELPRGTEKRWLFQILVTACVVLGPLSLLAHLARCHFVRIGVGAEGLELARGRRIPFNAIQGIDYRAAPFRGGGSLDASTLGDIGNGCAAFSYVGEGCILGLALGILLGISYWIFLPVLTLFSPWHARVIVHLKDGDRLVFRDLENDAEFVSLLRLRIQ